MVENKENLIKCAKCSFKAPSNVWEMKLLGDRFLLCQRCRDYSRGYYNNQSEETREILLAKASNRYATDENWRNHKIVEITALRKSKINCTACGKLMQYGSLLAHKKCCKGGEAKSTLTQLLELSVANGPLVDSVFNC